MAPRVNEPPNDLKTQPERDRDAEMFSQSASVVLNIAVSNAIGIHEVSFVPDYQVKFRRGARPNANEKSDKGKFESFKKRDP